MSVHIYNLSEAIGNCAVGLMTVQRIAEFAEDFVLKPNGFLVPKSIYKIQSLSKVAPALAIATLPMIFSNTCSALEKICRGTSRDVVIDTLTIAGGAACMISIGSYALCPEARFGITALGYGIDLAGLVYSGLSGADSRDLALQALLY